jgi:hypothetical protein
VKVEVRDPDGNVIGHMGPAEGACVSCRERPATGVIFQLCDACFDAFEARVEAHVAATGQPYPLSDREFEAVNEPIARRKD